MEKSRMALFEVALIVQVNNLLFKREVYFETCRHTNVKLEIQKRSFSRFGTLVWNNIAAPLRDKPKTVYRKTIYFQLRMSKSRKLLTFYNL